MKILMAFLLLTTLSAPAYAESYEDYLLLSQRYKENGGSTFGEWDALQSALLAGAKSGDVRAQFHLGMDLYGITNTEGFNWLLKAAEQGHSKAQFMVAGMYLRGELVDQDFQKAFYWMDICSSLGQSKCHFYLGQFYEKGIGGARHSQSLADFFYDEGAHAGDQRAREYLCQRGGSNDWCSN